MTSGVRQGCPLSPLLFVLTVDMLLRTLQENTPPDGTCIRAFADDVGMTLPDVSTHLSSVLQVYEQFASFSGLSLNLPKTVIIPLWEVDLAEDKRALASMVPRAGRMSFATRGTFLGFAVGPTRQEHMWENCLGKFQSRF